MGIKKIIANSSPSTSFKINKENALLLLEMEDSTTQCLFIEVPFSIGHRSKLLQIGSIASAKFIGGKEILNIIKEMSLPWRPFNRVVEVVNEMTAIFYSQSGKVRISKDHNTSEMMITSPKKKILIIDDSKTIQKLLTKVIESSDKLEVMAVADGPSCAKKIIEKEKPDLITLDIHMPEMNGVDFLKSYLKFKSIPTVMISSVTMTEGPLVMEALANGADTYIEKPEMKNIESISSDIVEELETVANRNCVLSYLMKKVNLSFNHFDGLIAIGSSTGGTQALQKIFTALPGQIPPIVVVQHIPAVFSKALADRLDSLCPFKIKEAEDGEILQQNTVYIAPGGKQLKLKKSGKEKKIIINDDPPLNRFRPSVDYFFNSLPFLEENRIIGIILTGMGKDGSEGLLKVKESGSFTIAQDEASSVVFGMPREAIEIGAACQVSSLQEIPFEIVKAFNKLIKKAA